MIVARTYRLRPHDGLLAAISRPPSRGVVNVSSVHQGSPGMSIDLDGRPALLMHHPNVGGSRWATKAIARYAARCPARLADTSAR